MKTLLKIILFGCMVILLTGCAMGPAQLKSLGTGANAFSKKQQTQAKAKKPDNLAIMVNKHPGCNSWCHNHWCSVHCGPDPY